MTISQKHQDFLLTAFLHTLCFGLIATFVLMSAQAAISVKLLGSFFVSSVLFLLFHARYLSMKEKNHSLTHLCHTLRTPLTTICGVAEMFEGAQENLNPDQKHLIYRLVSSATTLKNLVTKRVDFSETKRKTLIQDESPDLLKKFFPFI
jgi:signal transduction histidine kinase